MNKNFIIEVKTKWKLNNSTYEREIIEYTYNKYDTYVDESIYAKFLKNTNKYIETSNEISSNEYEFKILNSSTHEEIENPSILISTLLNFTKYQFLKEEAEEN